MPSEASKNQEYARECSRERLASQRGFAGGKSGGVSTRAVEPRDDAAGHALNFEIPPLVRALADEIIE